MIVDATMIAQAVVLSVLMAGLFASVAVALTLEAGVTRIINFAHGEFVMLGAYVVYLLQPTSRLSLVGAMLLAGVGIAAFSWLVFRFFLSRVLKQPEHDQLLATLGLSIILVNVALMAFSPTPRMLQPPQMLPSFHLGSVVVPGSNLFVALVGFGMYGVLWWLVYRTRWGIQMRLASADPELAGYTGVNVDRMFAISFVLGGAIAGVSGGLVATVLAIQPGVGVEFLIRAFAMVIFGGLGSIPGALIGAILLMTIDGLASVMLPGGASWAFGVSFLFLLFILVIRPKGLFGRAGMQ